MRKKHSRYTREELEPIVRESISVAEVLRKLGLTYNGGSYAHIQKKIDEFGIDRSHFMGQRSNSGPRHRGGAVPRPPEEVLVLRGYGSKEKAPSLRRSMMELGVSEECHMCGLGRVWNGLPITLQIDHINGVNHDHRIENLRFLCPNCHSQTDNWCSKNRGVAQSA